MKVFECLKIFFKRYKLVSFGVFILLVIGLITVPRIFAELQPVKSVEILSEKTNFNEKEAGSWKIDKSAQLIDKDIVEVKMELETLSNVNNRKKDVVFLVDTSESLNEEKLFYLKSGIIDSIDKVLLDSDNRVGIISFNKISTLVADLSNNKNDLISKINELTINDGTNYYQALKSVEDLLKNYPLVNDREINIVLITDGKPNNDTPNEVGEYNFLKTSYPLINIIGLQYEAGDDIFSELKKVSDKQYVSNRDNFSEIIKSIVKGSNKFEEFRVEDFINSEMFNIEDITDIKVDRGSVSLDNNTISWNLDDVMSFNKARMTYKLKLNKTSERIYPVGEKIEVNSKLGEMVEEVESPKTPVLSNSYKVIYDGNEPEGCRVEGIPEDKEHLIFDLVGISEVEPVCSGYQFKGWDITTSGVSKINDDYFTMPEEDVILKAKWSKLNIKKSMDGKVSQGLTLYSQVAMDALSGDRYAKKYTGSTETFNGNKDVYYYYGEAANNNVIFGDYCWKIVRTTDTGGVKLLYNGVPSSDLKCNNSGDASALTREQMGTSSNTVAFNSNYNSLADVGYMNNKRYPSNSKSMTSSQTNSQNILSLSLVGVSTGYYYSDNYIWNGSGYRLDTPELVNWKNNYQSLVGKYTCNSTFDTSICTSLRYITGTTSSSMYYLELTKGKTIKDETITFSNSIHDNGDGTYTLSNPVIIEKKDWYTNYGSYKNYYTCGNNEITCDTSNIKYITGTSATSIFYILGSTWNKYGNSFTWDGTNYTLVDTINIINLSQSGVLNNNHYTCFNSSGVCSELNYIYYINSGTPYYVKLNNGNSIEDALDEMLYNDDVNTNDSTIKSAIDYWYSNNMTQYTDYLEDTVWCNDRSMDNKESNGWNPNGGSTDTLLIFKSYRNLSNLNCQNRNDRFSVNKENGNGVLKYPVGLISKQEQNLAYFSSKSSLASGNYYWGLSPGYFNNYNYTYGYGVNSAGSGYSDLVSLSYGVRPSVSLRTGIEYMSGDGSGNYPYIIDMDS